MRKGHVSELQQQIQEKEKERLLERKAFFEEGVKLDNEANARRARLDEIKQRKLEELKAAGIEDQYLHPLKRLVQAAPTQKFSV